MSDRSQRFPAYIAAIAQVTSLLLLVAIGLLAKHNPHSRDLPRLQAVVQALQSIRTYSLKQ